MKITNPSMALAALATSTLLTLGAVPQANAVDAGKNSATSGAGGSMAATDATGSMSSMGAMGSSDRNFVMNAAKGGMDEVMMGEMAKQKASSDTVKQFASKMVDDHTKANDELKQLASSKGISLPSAAPAPAASKHLDSMSGAAFDHQYMTMMVADHKKTIALFEKGARAKDSDIKAFATKTLPTLKSHLQMAQQTLASTSASANMSGSKG